jgi:hypothetical protein
VGISPSSQLNSRDVDFLLISVDSALERLDLEGDFDPEKHDAQMKGAFDEDYYEAEDSDMVFNLL